jgi:hypothetical protein
MAFVKWQNFFKFPATLAVRVRNNLATVADIKIRTHSQCRKQSIKIAGRQKKQDTADAQTDNGIALKGHHHEKVCEIISLNYSLGLN